jgi:antitoxin (DNA-binding transcriptional repressor) of toxin-antitoxin stability system
MEPAMGECATITATLFRATCLQLMDRLARGEIERLEVTKRGKVVAVMVPPVQRSTVHALFGALRGSVTRPEGLDLTAPVFDGVIEAERDATSPC